MKMESSFKDNSFKLNEKNVKWLDCSNWINK